MGLLTILKKMKQKEKEVRLLMLPIRDFVTRTRPAVAGSTNHSSQRLHQGQWNSKQSSDYTRTTYINVQVNKYNCGLDNAGKTTILKKFNGEDISTISPTLGFNIKTLEHRGFKLNVWDVGGQKSLRSYWRNYFESTDGLIWVVDCADRRRLLDCKQELHSLLLEERLSGATLLVFANKQDLPGSLPADDIRQTLELDNIKTHHWLIIGCSAVTGDNLLYGIDWLVSDIASRIFTMD